MGREELAWCPNVFVWDYRQCKGFVYTPTHSWTQQLHVGFLIISLTVATLTQA